MKKLLGILAIVTLLSCSKDDNEPDPACDCGTVTEVVVLAPQRYQTKIKNNCTGVIEDYLLLYEYQVGWTKCN